MIRFLRWSLWVYRRCLFLYPEDLRRGFGAEMMEAFAQDLVFESSARGFSGVVHVWRVALREVLAIGLPGLLEIPAIIVPVLAAATTIVLQSPLLIMTFRRQAQSGDASPIDAAVWVSISAVVTALTSFVAVYRWERRGLVVIPELLR
jgi:hypothetical protein